MVLQKISPDAFSWQKYRHFDVQKNGRVISIKKLHYVFFLSVNGRAERRFVTPVRWIANYYRTQTNTLGELVDALLILSWWRHRMQHFSRYWHFVRGIPRSPANSPHKGQWRRALMFSLICANRLLSKQWRRWGFRTSSRSLWRHHNGLDTCYIFVMDANIVKPHYIQWLSSWDFR